MAAETRIVISAKDSATPVIQRVEQELIGLRHRVESLGSLAGGAALAGSLIGVGDAALQAAVKMEKLSLAYATIAGDSAGAARQLDYLRQEADRLGLSYVSTAEQAKGFFAAVKGTTLEGDSARNIFSGVMEAAAAQGLGSDEVSGILRALSQMASKGKVLAEEMRTQLGEHLPGTFQIAARAMGVTTAQLDKLMADGRLFSEEFLPRFGEQMHKEFGAASLQASKTAQAALNQLSSAWTEAKAAFSQTDTAVTGIRVVTEALAAFAEAYGGKTSVAEPLPREVGESFRAVAGYTDEAAVALGAWLAARRLATSETLLALRADSQMLGVQGALRERFINSNRALKEKVATERQAAEAEVTRLERQKMVLMAEERRADRLAVRTIGTRNEARAEQVLSSVRQRLAVVTNELTVAEGRLAAALRGASMGTMVLTGLKSAASGLLGVLGGPWGAAFTAAALAMYGIHSAARESREELEQYKELIADIGKKGEEAAGGLDKFQQSALIAAKNTAADKLEEARKKLEDFKKSLRESGTASVLRSASGSERFFGYDESTLRASTVMGQVASGALEAKEAFKQANALKEEFGKTGPIQTLYDALVRLQGQQIEEKKLQEDLAAAQDRYFSSLTMEEMLLDKSAGAVAYYNRQLQKTISLRAQMEYAGMYPGAGNDAFEKLTAKEKEKSYLNTLKGRQQYVAKGLLQSQTGLGLQDVRDAMRNGFKNLSPAAREFAEALQGAFKEPKKSGGGASRIENAKRSLEALNAEIGRLNGTGSAADLALTKKIHDIEKIGASAKLSGTELSGLKARYEEAFATDVLRKFDDELLKLSGDAKAVRLHGIDKQMAEWRTQLEALTRIGQLDPEDMENRLSRMRAALEKQADYKDLHTAAGFYRELGELSGDYTRSVETQNQLIALQADLHRRNGMPPDLVAEWELLQKINAARDPLSGLQRAMRATATESGNMAAAMEDAWTGMSRGMEDAIVAWGTTSKFTIEDVGNTMLEMIWRIAAQNIVTGPMNSIFGSLLGSFTGGGWGSTSDWMPMLDMGIPGFHAGGMASEPTFARRMPVSIFEAAPRFHAGRLPWNPATETPAVLRRDEAVLTPGQMRTLAGLDAATRDVPGPAARMEEYRAMLARRERENARYERMLSRSRGTSSAAAAAAAAPLGRGGGTVTVNVYENTAKARAEVAQTPTANGMRIDVTILDVVNRDIARGGRTDRTMQTVYGLKRKA